MAEDRDFYERNSWYGVAGIVAGGAIGGLIGSKTGLGAEVLGALVGGVGGLLVSFFLLLGAQRLKSAPIPPWIYTVASVIIFCAFVIYFWGYHPR